MSAVAMLLMSWPNVAVMQEQAGQQGVRPGAADDADERVGHEVRGAGLGHGRRERDHAGHEHDRRPEMAR